MTVYVGCNDFWASALDLIHVLPTGRGLVIDHSV
jgi:hypothetical protein